MTEGTISIRGLLRRCGNLGVKAAHILKEVHELRLAGGKDGLKLVDKGAAQGKAFDPQTVADRRSERLIVEGLRGAFGDGLSVVGEESGLAGTEREEEREEREEDDAFQRQHEQDALLMLEDDTLDLDWWPGEDEAELVSIKRVSVWIDPLDATREYTEGHVEFCTVLIGIAIDGRSVAGVMVEPFAVEPCLFWGRVGKGCFQTFLDFATVRRRSARISIGRSILFGEGKGDVRIIVSRSRQGGVVQHFTQRFENLLKAKHGLSCNYGFAGGCGHKILQILRQKADIYPFPCSGTSMWDSCAGDALIEAAGGLLLDKKGRRLVFSPLRSEGKGYENNNGLIASCDAQLCRLATSAISGCLDFMRNTSGEWISEATLSRSLGAGEVASIETPLDGLRVDPTQASVELSLVATMADGSARRLAMRKFEPLSLLPEAGSARLDCLFASRASELFYFEKVAPILGQRPLLLDRTSSRRSPTVRECLEARETRPNKMFLQAMTYAVIREDAKAVVETIDDKIAAIKRFHGIKLEEEIMLEVWRFEYLDALQGETADHSSKAMRMSAGTLESVAAGVVLVGREEEEDEADEPESKLYLREESAASTRRHHAKDPFLSELARLDRLAVAAETHASPSLLRNPKSPGMQDLDAREAFLQQQRQTLDNMPAESELDALVESKLHEIRSFANDPASSFSGELPPFETQAGDPMEGSIMLAAELESMGGVPSGPTAMLPARKRVLLRGLWRSSPSSSTDFRYLISHRPGLNEDERLVRCLDLAHLLLVCGSSLTNLEAIHRVYFDVATPETAVALLIKRALLLYLRNVAPTAAFAQEFGETVKTRARLVAKALADELEAAGRLDARNLDCFSVGESAAPNSPSRL